LQGEKGAPLEGKQQKKQRKGEIKKTDAQEGKSGGKWKKKKIGARKTGVGRGQGIENGGNR